jgi:oxygen-independent coproporphyrinogen-3 oxidase
LSGRNGTAVAGYVKSLEYEIRERRDSCTDAMHTASCDTLYFGGGTPSLLSPEEVCSIASAIGKRFGIDSFDEFTLEANPDDIAGTSSCNGYLSSLRSAGVNRLSLGIQSFDDARLKFMNRRHDAAEAVAAFEAARNAGFDNISCDLIFGYGGLSLEGWKADINELLALKPEHVSCYQMSIERGSALEKLASSGRYSPLPDDECADQYALLQSMLAAAGYEQYEVSNFALPGFRSRHNSSYWERTPYVGFGPAAHSFDGACIRRWNLPDLSRYDRCYPGSGKCFCQEELTGDDVFNEQVMLSLRRVTGLDPQALDKERLSMERPDLDRLLDTGLLEYVPGTGMRMVRIPASKLFVSDSIIEELFV